MAGYQSSGFKLAYEVTPISLNGGLAGSIPGGVFSIINLLQMVGIDDYIDITLDGAIAHYVPNTGATLIDYQVATYPLANMAVAANAVIKQPLVISLTMHIPVREAGGYALKTFIMTALKSTLENHIQQGGWFGVATPSYFYDNCLLTRLSDVSSGESKQAQVSWQWDFFKPLLTEEEADDAQNAMMSLLSSGGATDGALSGMTPSIGAPSTTAAPALIPGSAGAIAGGIGLGGF